LSQHLKKEKCFMPRDPNELGTPHDWLKRAKSNLIRAKQPKPEGR